MYVYLLIFYKILINIGTSTNIALLDRAERHDFSQRLIILFPSLFFKREEEKENG